MPGKPRADASSLSPTERTALVVEMAKAKGCGLVATEPYWLGSVEAAERALAVVEARYTLVREETP